MSENLFGLTVATDKGLDDLQCQRLLRENRKYQGCCWCARDLLFRGGKEHGFSLNGKRS